MPANQIYDQIFYVLAGMLVVGFAANLLIRPVAEKWFMKEADVMALQAKAKGTAAAVQSGSFGIGTGGFDLLACLAWAAVGIPLIWAIWQVVVKASVIFQ